MLLMQPVLVVNESVSSFPTAIEPPASEIRRTIGVASPTDMETIPLSTSVCQGFRIDQLDAACSTEMNQVQTWHQLTVLCFEMIGEWDAAAAMNDVLVVICSPQIKTELAQLLKHTEFDKTRLKECVDTVAIKSDHLYQV